MKYTDKQREDAVVMACGEWLKTRWGQEYSELIRYLPENKADEVRLMLQGAIRQAMSHRPNELISTIEVDRQYKNLLDSNRLETYEALARLFKDAVVANEKRAAEVETERAALAGMVAATEKEAEFQREIEQRQEDDAANKKVDIKELRRRALFGSDRVNGHLKTTPMPASIQIFSRSPKQPQ